MQLRRLLYLSVVLLLEAADAFAQVPTGTITGVVRDESGAVVPRALITITNQATGETRSLNSGSDGTYSAASLPPGEYEVKVRTLCQETATPLIDLSHAMPDEAFVDSSHLTVDGQKKFRNLVMSEISDHLQKLEIIDRSP